MRTTALSSSCALYSWLCWLPSSRKSPIGIPIEFSTLLQTARTKLDWEFVTLYSVLLMPLRTSGVKFELIFSYENLQRQLLSMCFCTQDELVSSLSTLRIVTVN